MPRQEQIALRVRPELKSAVQALADREGRTLSNFVERVLSDLVESEAPKPKRKNGK